MGSSNAPKTMNIHSAQILASKYHIPLRGKKKEIFREMPDSGAGGEKKYKKNLELLP